MVDDVGQPYLTITGINLPNEMESVLGIERTTTIAGLCLHEATITSPHDYIRNPAAAVTFVSLRNI